MRVPPPTRQPTDCLIEKQTFYEFSAVSRHLQTLEQPTWNVKIAAAGMPGKPIPVRSREW